MELGEELPREVASILNQLGFQVNGHEVEAHNVVAVFSAVRFAFNRIRDAAGEGSAVAWGLPSADPLPVSPATVGAPVDPAAAALDERPSPNLDPDAWADGGRPDVPLDDPDPEPISSPPAPWPEIGLAPVADCGWYHAPGSPCHHREPAESLQEPPTPTDTRTPGGSAVSVALNPVADPVPLGPEPDPRERHCWSCPDNPHNPDAVPGPCCLDPAHQPEPGTDPPPDPWTHWTLPSALDKPSPWLLRRRAQVREGVAVPAVYPGARDAGKVIVVPIPEVIPPEPDWLAPTTRLPKHRLEEFADPPLHVATAHALDSPVVERPRPGRVFVYDRHLRRTRDPLPATTPEEAWAYPVPQGE